MEEVDSIILHCLRQLNVNIEDVKNICDLSIGTIIEAVSKCINTINPSLKAPAMLPHGISQRIEVAATVASLCKDLGYKNDVGYQTFLYYNEAELRQVFMFLIEGLPSEGRKNISPTTVCTTDRRSLLLKSISLKIKEEFNTVWIPPCCNITRNKRTGDCSSGSFPKLTHKPDKEELVKKLQMLQEIQLNLQQRNKGAKENIPNMYEDSLAETIVEHKIDKSLKELKEEVYLLRKKLDSLESENNSLDVDNTQAKKIFGKAEVEFANVMNILNDLGICEIENISDITNIFQNVQNNVNLLHIKSEEITSRKLFVQAEIAKIQKNSVSSQTERVKCKQKLVVLKANAKSMKEEYKKEEEMRNVLQKTFEQLKGGKKRSYYTKRILEIISNVDKQNVEIQKILEDTRQLQKEINSLEGQLDRCFSVADETLFRDAKKDDQGKKAYKLLALLHSECNTIVSLVNDTGTIAREIVDLEDNINTETAKRTEDTLKKIQLDLAKMLEEFKDV